MESRLSRADWMRAARRALLVGGPDAVRIAPLADALGVTKGSFYWHFTDRGELLEALLAEWEEECVIALAELPLLQGPDAVHAFMAFLKPHIAASERGDEPSDAAIYGWAAADATIARRVNAAEAQRVAMVQELAGDADAGEFVYLAYLGFIMRRRRSPSTNAFFASLATLAEQVAARSTKAKRVRHASRAATTTISHRKTSP